MGGFFLGPPFHWALVIALVALGWLAGLDRLHVTHFNLFTLVLLALSILVLAVILKSSPPGRQVTRDPLRAPDED